MGTYSKIEDAYADHGRVADKVEERSKEEIDNECLRLVAEMLRESSARNERLDVRQYCRASGLNIEYATRLLTENKYEVINFFISKKHCVSVEGEESTLNTQEEKTDDNSGKE